MKLRFIGQFVRKIVNAIRELFGLEPKVKKEPPPGGWTVPKPGANDFLISNTSPNPNTVGSGETKVYDVGNTGTVNTTVANSGPVSNT